MDCGQWYRQWVSARLSASSVTCHIVFMPIYGHIKNSSTTSLWTATATSAAWTLTVMLTAAKQNMAWLSGLQNTLHCLQDNSATLEGQTSHQQQPLKSRITSSYPPGKLLLPAAAVICMQELCPVHITLSSQGSSRLYVLASAMAQALARRMAACLEVSVACWAFRQSPSSNDSLLPEGRLPCMLLSVRPAVAGECC